MLIFCAHSLRYQLKKPFLLFSLIAMALLLCWSLFITSQEWQHYVEHQTEVSHTQQHLWQNQGDLNPHSAAHHGLYAFKTWHPLSFVDPGLQAYLGSTLFLEAHRQNVGRFAPAQDQLRLSELSVFTPAALFQHAIPLVIILLGYGLIADLRSQGTLSFLITQQLTRAQIFLSQIFVVYTLLLMTLFPVVCYAWVLLIRLGDTTPWSYYLLFAGAYLLYWGIFIHLTLLASAYFKHSRQALLVLLLLWMFNGLALPRSLMNPQNLPAYSVLEQKIQTDMQALPDWGARTEIEDKRLRKQYQLSPQDPLPVNLDAEVLKASEKEETAIYAQHMQSLRALYEARLADYYRWQYAVPFLALQHLSQGLSQSDLDDHHQFLVAAEAYRQDFILRLNQSLVKQSAQETFSYTADQQLWNSIPPFEGSGSPPAQRFFQWLISFSVLVLWWLASVSALIYYKTRYGVLS